MHTSFFVREANSGSVWWRIASMLAPGLTRACTVKSLPTCGCISSAMPLEWLSPRITILFLRLEHSEKTSFLALLVCNLPLAICYGL